MPFQREAERLRIRHKREYPEYKYQPRRRRQQQQQKGSKSTSTATSNSNPKSNSDTVPKTRTPQSSPGDAESESINSEIEEPPLTPPTTPLQIAAGAASPLLAQAHLAQPVLSESRRMESKYPHLPGPTQSAAVNLSSGYAAAYDPFSYQSSDYWPHHQSTDPRNPQHVQQQTPSPHSTDYSRTLTSQDPKSSSPSPSTSYQSNYNNYFGMYHYASPTQSNSAYSGYSHSHQLETSSSSTANHNWNS